tara:strand:- start:1206 stop:2018 length:813 start_codon:yes stop_codon:yes gene_type:complete
MAQHRGSIRWRSVRQTRLLHAIQKYGWDSFQTFRLEDVPNDRLDDAERKWIRTLCTLHPNGYNLQSGGRMENGGVEVAAETRAKISANKKREWQENRDVMLHVNGPEAMKKQMATLMAKQEKRLAGLSGKQLHVAKRNIKTGRKNAQKQLAKRQAQWDPKAWEAWQKENAKMSTKDRQSLAMAQKRVEKMATMNPVDAALWLHRLRVSAIHTAERRGIPFENLERWYPNVLTMQEIRALQSNGGAWPRTQASAQTGGKPSGSGYFTDSDA